jgi:nucleotide-binding universal stress UspA family protein
LLARALTGFLRGRQLFLLTLPRNGDVGLGREKKCKGNPMKMSIKNILIPLDLMRSPCDALVYARNMAADAPICVTLLYVLNLNIVPPGRQIYDELCAESEAALRKLARFFFGADGAARVVVRVGAPHEEIIAEAKERPADLIILSGPDHRTWKQLLRPGTTQKIIEASPCPAVVLPRHRKAAPQWPSIPTVTEAAPEEALLPAA